MASYGNVLDTNIRAKPSMFVGFSVASTCRYLPDILHRLYVRSADTAPSFMVFSDLLPRANYPQYLSRWTNLKDG